MIVKPKFSRNKGMENAPLLEWGQLNILNVYEARPPYKVHLGSCASALSYPYEQNPGDPITGPKGYV
ncbi:MAG: hypothetical protein EB101_09545 [Chitinophagia bacterium]|nr:hypothetical protein [Chitinophagia bacterium]